MQGTLRKLLATFITGLATVTAYGQALNPGPAVEQWRLLLPYNQIEALDTDGDRLFCATASGFFTYERSTGAVEAYSKARGMHGNGLVDLAYDKQTGIAVLAYKNSDIDLFKNYGFDNLPDLKNSGISGDKTIYHAEAARGMAYLSTGLGLVVLNLGNREVKETVIFYDSTLAVPVYASALDEGRIYVATGSGVFRTDADNPFIQNYATWEQLSPRPARAILASGSSIYAATGDSLIRLDDTGGEVLFRAGMPIDRLDPGQGGVWVTCNPADDDPALAGRGLLVDASGQVIDSIAAFRPSSIIQLPGGEIWYGDKSNYQKPQFYGLRRQIAPGETQAIIPAGPVVSSSFDISARNGELWVAHGGYNQVWNAQDNFSNYSVFRPDGGWQHYSWVADNWLVKDFVRILKDPRSGNVYAASYSGGLVVDRPGGEREIYNVGYLPEYFGNPGICRVSGLALDTEGNLWIANNGATSELAVMTREGTFYMMKPVPGNTNHPPHSASDVIVDDYGQKWFVTNSSGNGAVVYDDGGTLSNTADDRSKVFRMGEGAGNLPDNTALCIAKDLDGAIWIGTANGIGIINCPGSVFSEGCEAELRTVKFDAFADYLFVNQMVNAIAVDGANRKWVGTANGAWLISEDAQEEIYRFTAENSPLPSNNIRRINIDPVTGDVYFSTDDGIACFRSTATQGQAEHADPLLVYPNPVPTGYQGMIAVRGLAENADVRFTDVSGQLVYRTRAAGGQAVWNGRDYTGRRVQSGVYLIFVVSEDGASKTTGKLIFHE